ncbi:MAG TPA: ATP-grasp domain-containing protein, partial [Aestuariivirga sp.]|nr:ATP-grasp domain-containing protein [Aestuariivirga sp.]
MNIHEYQAKEVLRSFGVPTGKGIPAFSADEAVKAAHTLGGPVWVVKAQIHAGGRGKGGGVKVVKSIEEVRAEAKRMLGMTLVTHQTGPQGKRVASLYIEEGTAIARELYLSCLVDRETSKIAFIASTEGGVNIEEVAAKTPEKIVTVRIDPAAGYSSYAGRRIARALKLEGDQVKQCVSLIGKL